MQLRSPTRLVRCATASCIVLCGCHPDMSSNRRVTDNFIGVVTNADGTSAPGASITITNLTTKVRASVTKVDGSGAFHLSAPAGEYVVTVTSDSGFAILDK